MGVPFYCKVLSRKYPQAFRHSAPSSVGCLLLDFNSIVHVCAAEEIAVSDPTDQGVVERVKQRVRVLCQQHYPHAARGFQLILAMDGVPPMAKVLQQRKRRFLRGAQDAAGTTWDTNKISPGTRFMQDMAAQLQLAFPAALILDTELPGEGEQKIFKLLRNQDTSGTSSVIFGPDADLIQLALLVAAANPGLRLYVARPPQPPAPQKAGVYIDISCLARCIHLDTSPVLPLEEALLEHVALMALFGNDFVPGLPCLHLDVIDYAEVQAAYNIVANKNHRLVVGRTPCLDIQGLRLLLEALCGREREMMSRKHSIFVRCCTPGSKPPIMSPSRDHRWRSAFYAYSFSDTTPQQLVCSDFLKSCVWTLRYYTSSRSCDPPPAGRKSWNCHGGGDFAYPHAYGPLLMDLMGFLCELESARMPEHSLCAIPPSEAVVTTEELLILILPPSSSGLLRKRHHSHIHTDGVLGCKYMFPKSFRCLDYLKMVPWTREPLLPPISVSSIRAAMRALDAVVSQDAPAEVQPGG
jgi:5'-3' exonuclease